MVKAVLMLAKMPETCKDCLCWDENYAYCMPTGQDTPASPKGRLRDCPLKPTPTRVDANEARDRAAYWEALGWNACLDELEGKT